jgi:hypothetical protein
MVLWRIITGSDIDHHKLVNAFGMVGGKSHGNLAPEAMSAQGNGFQAHLVKPPEQIISHGKDRYIRGMKGISMVAQVKSEGVPTLAQGFADGTPIPRGTEQSMQEHDLGQGRISRLFVKDLGRCHQNNSSCEGSD